ncbi:MAG: 3-methylitaconate isomerase [Nitrososphaerota archaeon]|nr:3-methylitaconate isomerase [Nitrososphaerota archaeon]
MVQSRVPCVIMRGGTSKGVFFKKADLPSSKSEMTDVILRVFGSGDPMQIDGLGGTHAQTSKTMVVSRSKQPGVDVDYLFGQVEVERKSVDYRGNCGNLTSAVGPFAIDEGLFRARGSSTKVRLFNTNTRKRVDASVQLEGGKTKYEGNYFIDGVPNPGARIDVTWYDPGGAVTGALFPTGNVVDRIPVQGRAIQASVVDASNPVVFVRAEDVGMKGTELPDDVSQDTLRKSELIRSKVCEMIGLVKEAGEATSKSPHIPFIAVVANPQNYTTSTGARITRHEYNVLPRLFSMQKMHHAYAVTGAICTAVAATIPGTIVNERSRAPAGRVVIAHPKGLIDVAVQSHSNHKGAVVDSVTVGRTARRLMAGSAFYIKD